MLRMNCLIPMLVLLAPLLLSACQPVLEPMATSVPTPPPAPSPMPSPTPSPVPSPRPSLTPAPAPSPTATPSPVAKVEMQLKKDEITSQALAGNLLGDPNVRTFYVLLPPSYDISDSRYPVVYVLPWGDGDPSANAWGFKTAAEELLRTGKSKEMIVVVPDGTNKLRASHFRSSPTIGDYETYVTQELVDYVDTHYRTLLARDSRGLTGCSNGGDATMRLAFKYPSVYSVAVVSGGVYDETPESNKPLLEELATFTALPKDVNEVVRLTYSRHLIPWFIQVAAGTSSRPDKPPLYLDMPFRIVDEHAEIVPEISAQIVAHDSAHEARRYAQQPLRLHGILILHALYDNLNPTELVRGFDQLLTELGIEHEYVELEAGHCDLPWEYSSLTFMADHLVFEQP